MKRLLERDDLQGAERALSELLQAEPAFRADPFRKRRVLVKLSRPHVSRRRRFGFKPLVAAMLVSGVALGALGTVWLTPPSKSPSSDLPADDASGAAAPAGARHAARKPASTTRPAAPKASAGSESVAPSSSAVPRTSSSSFGAAAGLEDSSLPRPVARTSAPYPRGEDPSSVVRAIVALRNEKDPERASRLLKKYLAKHPSGSLSEDALALSIEAASRDHDPRAVALARHYLARYPHGRYSSFARKALRELGPEASSKGD